MTVLVAESTKLRTDWLYHASSGPVIAQILQSGVQGGKESRRGTPSQQGVSFTRSPRVIREFGGWAVAIRRSSLERLGQLRDVDFFGANGDGSGLDEEEERYVGPTVPPSAIEAVITTSSSRSSIRMFDFPFPLMDTKGNVLKEELAHPDMVAVNAIATDKAFARRVLDGIRNAPGAGAAAAKKAVTSEINLYLNGGHAVYNVARLKGSSPEEVQALISLATHAVLMATVPGSTFAVAGSTIARFALKRVFSTVAWRAVDAVSQRISRNVKESLDVECLALVEEIELNEVIAMGDCFEAAVKLLWDEATAKGARMVPDFKIVKSLLVHAEVTGQGQIAGLKYGHAWVERNGYVYDFSNGKTDVMAKAVYYAAGQIVDKPGKLYRYTGLEAKKFMLRTSHYGPWELETESGL